MFAKTIALSDAFLDMPLGARCLYFTLGMVADDDGFVNSPRSVMRQCGATEDDMKILIAKKFVLVFDSGVIVIKHWRINNYLQKDRYNETKYLEEKATLIVDEKGAYKQCIHNSVYTGKDSIGKDSIGYSFLRKKENKEIYDNVKTLIESELLHRQLTNIEEEDLAKMVNEYEEKDIVYGIREAVIYEKPSISYVMAVAKKRSKDA